MYSKCHNPVFLVSPRAHIFISTTRNGAKGRRKVSHSNTGTWKTATWTELSRSLCAFFVSVKHSPPVKGKARQPGAAAKCTGLSKLPSRVLSLPVAAAQTAVLSHLFCFEILLYKKVQWVENFIVDVVLDHEFMWRTDMCKQPPSLCVSVLSIYLFIYLQCCCNWSCAVVRVSFQVIFIDTSLD